MRLDGAILPWPDVLWRAGLLNRVHEYAPVKIAVKRLVQRAARCFGYQLVPVGVWAKASRALALADAAPSLLFQVDPVFQSSYAMGLAITGTPESGQVVCSKRQSRFYNLLSIHRWAGGVPGWQVECGCWKGLSSYLLNQQAKRLKPSHDGAGFMIVDSFEGLSQPTREDRVQRGSDPPLPGGEYTARAGTFYCPQDAVRKALSEFPAIEYHQGWIPEVLSSLPERTYSFVHIDLDLHDPIRGAVDYFFPRLEKGGVIVLDDYGSLTWPGALKGGDDAAAALGQPLTPLSTGQALLVRR